MLSEPPEGKPPAHEIQNDSVLAMGSAVRKSSAVPGSLKPAASTGSAEESPRAFLGSREAGKLDTLPKRGQKPLQNQNLELWSCPEHRPGPFDC